MMHELAGQRKGTKKYFYDGYFYHSDPRYTLDLNVYICTYRYRQWQCPVTARANLNEIVTVRGEHGHSRISLQEYLRFEEFKKKLKQQARESVAAPNAILETLRIEYSDVAHLIQKTSAKMHILRERSKCQPKPPENLKDLGNYLMRYESARGIFQGQVVISEKSSAVIFASDAMLQHLNNCEEIYVDGTFKCVPKKIGAKQLLIVHMKRMNVGMASVYVLCSNRTTELYGEIWKFLIERAPGLKTNLKFIMMDFERALIKSVREHISWVTIRGCWFHYTRAISTHWRDLGLKNVPSPLVQDVLALAWGLPLLPAEKFSVAIEIYRQKAEQVEPEYQESVEQFISYLENQWLRIAEIVSLWRSPTRTNNICESFHGRLPQRLGCHPNLFAFINKLTTIITEIDNDWQNLERNGNSVENKRLKQAAIDSYINYQQRLFSNGKLNVGEFLMKIKTKNIKNFIEFMMYAPHNIKNFSSEEIVNPEEFMDLLGYPQTMGLKNYMAVEVEEVMQKERPVIQILEVIQGPVAMPEESELMQEVYIILEEEEEDTSKTVTMAKKQVPSLEETEIKQKLIGSPHTPKISSKREKSKKLRSRPTGKPAEFCCKIDSSLKATIKNVKKNKKLRNQPVVELEPRYKLALSIKTALKRLEKKERPNDRLIIEYEPRYKLSPSLRAFLRREEKMKTPSIKYEPRYKLSPSLRASLRREEKMKTSRC